MPKAVPRVAPRVLVVARGGRLQRWACRRLLPCGFAVTAVDDGVRAIASAHRDPPDLIVLAHSVRGIDAGHLLYLLTSDARTARVRMIVLVAGTSGRLARVCRALGISVLEVGDMRPTSLSPA